VIYFYSFSASPLVESEYKKQLSNFLSHINGNSMATGSLLNREAESMASKLWRHRLAYIAMSLFVGWHTLAIIVAPAPDSVVTDALRVVLQPYLTLFRLDNHWEFFAPNVGDGSRFRYIIEDKNGHSHTFKPTEQLSWFHPNYFWARAWYYAIMDDPDLYADAAVARFCKEHAALHPVAITLLEYQEERFIRDDLLSGKNRNDPEFFTVKTIKRVKCPE
jgi:hypothetical protein